MEFWNDQNNIQDSSVVGQFVFIYRLNGLPLIYHGIVIFEDILFQPHPQLRYSHISTTWEHPH
jgi:hypothetical protein